MIAVATTTRAESSRRRATRGRTIAELAARIGVSPRRLLPILLDEERRGHLELVGEDWRVTPALLERHGWAFGRIAP